MKKVIFLVVIALVSIGLLSGCGGGSAIKGKDLLRDKAAIKEMLKEMKEKGGTPLMLFQHVNVSSDFVNFTRQDQKKPENVDNFVWTANTGWQGPKPVKLTGSGKLEDNLYNADEVNWEAIPDFVANAEKKAKEEGIEKAKIDGIQVYFSVREQKLSFSGTIKGERKDASVNGDIKTGAVTYFKVR